MRSGNLFRRKELASLLVLSAILLGLFHFSHNVVKLRKALEFYYYSRGFQADNGGQKSVPVTNVEIWKGGQRLLSRHFYTPFCASHDYSIYVLQCDLQDRSSLGSIRLTANDRQVGVRKLFMFKTFSAGLDHSGRCIYAFVHSDYVSTLQKLRAHRDLLAGYLLVHDLPAGDQIFSLEKEVFFEYVKRDRPWNERQYALPALSPDWVYEFSFEYRITNTARPFFIVGQHPTWFVHQLLPATAEHQEYKSFRIIARTPMRMDSPVLILRNWGGFGTAWYRDIRVRQVVSGQKPGLVSYEGDLGDLGGAPDIVERPFG